mgnify:CR=1 FL=1
MSKANYCISGSSWSYHFAERSNHYLCYIIEGMIAMLYRVFVDAGDMTSLQRAWETQQHVECKIHSTRKGMTKSVADAAVRNKVSIGLHPHDCALLCCATYIVVLF